MKKLFIIASLLFCIQMLQAQEPTKRNHATFEHGDLVASNTARLSDGEFSKAIGAYSPLVVGVYAEKTETSLMPTILVDGIAYIKFDASNGQVKVGDYVTSGSKPGYSIKATQTGYVVGVVLEDSSGDTGLVKIRIQPTWVKQ